MPFYGIRIEAISSCTSSQMTEDFMKNDHFHWPASQKCAVSLTYDDGLPVHYEYVGPALSEAGLLGTFNVLISGDPLQHPEGWRRLAQSGHELANHTLFHPCRWDPHMTWLEECYDLCDYTPKRLRAELEIANLVLSLLDGKRERTFGNTCCNTTIGRGQQEVSMDDVLRELFVAARGPFNRQIADVKDGINLMQVGHFGADIQNMSYEDIQETIERAAEMGGWAVFMIHGVGEGSHSLYMEKSDHEKLVAWLAGNKADIWTAPFIEVAKVVKAHGGSK
jgi:peptidoglycan/xylan/chitin deacetylase (PgdA/CDA1 family)